MVDRLLLLEEENANLREQVAYLKSCLMGTGVSYAFLGLTLYEERIFAALVARDLMSKDQLLTVAYAERVDVDLPSLKIVDVYICKIRKKIRRFDLDVVTNWGRGYSIDPQTKEKIRRLVASVGADRDRRAA